MYEIIYRNIKKKQEYEYIIKEVLEKSFEIENLNKEKWNITIILTNPNYIKMLNKEYRKIDKETDVLSFPMFEKTQLESIISKNKINFENILGDIVISIEQVKKQAEEYQHSFDRELSYMIVHGFYHLLGYDHIQEKEKIEMREKEENLLKILKKER